MKQSASQEPIVQLTKAEIEEKCLGEFVVMPSGCDEAFSTWWKSKGSADILSVRYPHKRHGLSGKVSNSAKTDTTKDFLDFVDANSQPNGRCSKLHCPTHYFLPKFTTIQIPKTTV